MSPKPALSPFSHATAIPKVRIAEDAWNARDPEGVALAYTDDCTWRNRATFLQGCAEIVRFLQQEWTRELDYRLVKELWTHSGYRIAVRFPYEWRDESGAWFRSYGNENWEFDAAGTDAKASRQHQRPADLRE